MILYLTYVAIQALFPTFLPEGNIVPILPIPHPVLVFSRLRQVAFVVRVKILELLDRNSKGRKGEAALEIGKAPDEDGQYAGK